MKVLLLCSISTILFLLLISNGNLSSHGQINSSKTIIQLSNLHSKELIFNGNISSNGPFTVEGTLLSAPFPNKTSSYLAIFTKPMNITGTIEPLDRPVNFTGKFENGVHSNGLIVNRTQISSTNSTDLEITQFGNLVIGGNVIITFSNENKNIVNTPNFGSGNPGCKHCH
jgi:hypothetical protein